MPTSLPPDHARKIIAEDDVSWAVACEVEVCRNVIRVPKRYWKDVDVTDEGYMVPNTGTKVERGYPDKRWCALHRPPATS